MYLVTDEYLKEWIKENMGIDAPDSAVKRLKIQLTVFTQNYFAEPKADTSLKMLNQPTEVSATKLGDLSAKSRRLYQNSVPIPEGRFHFGKVFNYDREDVLTKIILLWTARAVSLNDAKESKISSPLCSKTVELLDSSIFSDDHEATSLPVSDLRAAIARDKKHQRMMWVGFDGKNFYRQKEYDKNAHVIPMDGASELVSFFQADKEIMCSTVGRRLVLVGPQRAAVIE